jgi:hypothetical protein
MGIGTKRCAFIVDSFSALGEAKLRCLSRYSFQFGIIFIKIIHEILAVFMIKFTTNVSSDVSSFIG